MEVREASVAYSGLVAADADDVPVGYKRTEVGVIPEDWGIHLLGSIGKFKNGINKGSEAFGRGTPFVNLMDVFGVSSISSTEQLDLVTCSSFEQNAYGLRRGDVIFVRSSVKPSGVGLTALIEQDLLDTVYSGFLIRFRDSGFIQNDFKKFCFHESRFRRAIVDSSSVSANTNINQSSLQNISIPLPSTHVEQEAIAEVLSDADALIESLEQLLAKKRQIKQGAMQELLTGKHRLPGFSGKWESRPLRQFVRRFIVPMRDKPKKFSGDIPWCRIEDFDGMYLSHSKSSQSVDAETIQTMNLKVYPKGTLLVSCSADLGRCAIVASPLVSNQTFIGLEMDDEAACNVFFYYLMTSRAEELNNLSSGTTISYLSREQFEEFVISAPPSRREQAEVGEVLSDMDADLAELEAKLTKARQLKQGMMQALLTGRIRLPHGATGSGQ